MRKLENIYNGSKGESVKRNTQQGQTTELADKLITNLK
jgi:hypothetical protein